MLKIQLFGQSRIWIDDSEIKINRRKSRAVVYYLAASQHPVKRQLLIELFWIDLQRNKAQQTLRTTLHGLRKSLGEYLETDDTSVHLNRNVQVDVRSFEEIMSRADIEPSLLKSGLDLFQGDFLQDFYLPDSAAFEDWVMIQREVYQRLAKHGFHSLSKFYENQQNYSAALDAIDRALLIEPLQEDLQREAIRLVYLAGDRPGAIRRYDQLRKLLDEEMGVPPMAETRALYDAILLDKLPRPPQPPKLSQGPSDLASPKRMEQKSFHHRLETLPFIGRQEELQMLGNMSLRGNLLLIEGGPGLGKTRLAEEFAKIHPGLVLAGVARELEQSLPYQPFIEAFRRLTRMPQWGQWSKQLQAAIPAIWLSEAGRLVPDFNFPPPTSISISVTGNAGTPPTGESRLWEGIFQLLQGLTTLTTIILFIDDLHWADKSTLGLLGYLLRQFSDRISGQHINFIATARSEAEHPSYTAFLQMIQREDLLDRLNLNRLNAEEVNQLSNAMTREPNPSFSEWLMKNSEGIPFILAELVRYAQQNKILVEPPPGSDKPGFLVDQSTLSTSPVVPQTVYNLIKSRLDRLSEPSWRILSAAVAAGRLFDFAIVARASALSDSAALDAIDELLSAHIIEPLENGQFRFYHPLTMEVIYREVGDLRHRIQHRRIAEAMESIYSHSQLDSMAGVLAFHYAETNDPQRAAPYAILAGQQANRLSAWNEAAHFYRQALEGISGTKRRPVLMALGETAFQIGEINQAVDAFHEAMLLAQSDKDQAAIDQARLNLAQAYLIAARFDDSISLAKQVHSEGLPANVFKAEVSWGTALSLQGEDLEEAEKHLLAAVDMCDRASKENCEDLATIKFELGSIAAQQGSLKKAISLYQEALGIASEFDSETNLMRRILANNNIAYHMLLDGDARAEQYAQAGLKLAQEKGMLGQQPFLYSTLGEIALEAGKLEIAEEYFTKGLKLAQQLGMNERITGLTANLGRLALSKGQTSLAIHRFSTALARADNLGLYHLAAQIRIWLVPLLPPAEAKVQLKQARLFADRGKRQYLLEQIKNLEN